MKERPHNLIGKAFIKIALLLLRQEEWSVLVRIGAARFFQDLADLWRVFRAPRAYPDASMVLEQRLQRTDQAAAAGLPLQLPILYPDRDRDAIRNQYQFRHAHREASAVTAREWLCEFAIHVSRNSTSSSGGRSQNRANDSRTSVRTRTE